MTAITAAAAAIHEASEVDPVSKPACVLADVFDLVKAGSRVFARGGAAVFGHLVVGITGTTFVDGTVCLVCAKHRMGAVEEGEEGTSQERGKETHAD